MRVCNGECSDPEADFGTVVYSSAPDFFPGGPFRPMQKDMNLRSFSFDPPTSRLSCQVDFTEALDGLELRIAQDE